MTLGFSGTRDGMTPEQDYAVAKLIRDFNPTEAHHGDCVGADAEFHDLIRTGTDASVIIHPPIKNTWRAFCTATYSREPKGYLARDRDIVDETDRLVAAPKTFHQVSHSGTWYTIGYALSVGKPVTIVWPDGTVSDDFQPDTFTQ